jgi:uncharacterized protein (TIGR03086 family)
MSDQIDLRPAADRMARLVEGVPVDALDRPTPCARYTVGDLLDHVGGFALAFAAAARKTPLDGAPAGDGSRLAGGWRERIAGDLRTMAEAWADPEAWTGMTAAGGVDLPGDLAGRVALDELVVHGWDLARATGQPAGYDGPGVDAVHETVLHFRAANAEGLFGPEVEIAGDAPLLDRILGVTGRAPDWQPGG